MSNLTYKLLDSPEIPTAETLKPDPEEFTKPTKAKSTEVGVVLIITGGATKMFALVVPPVQPIAIGAFAFAIGAFLQ